jgi:hypothetical protein
MKWQSMFLGDKVTIEIAGCCGHNLKACEAGEPQ